MRRAQDLALIADHNERDLVCRVSEEQRTEREHADQTLKSKCEIEDKLNQETREVARKVEERIFALERQLTDESIAVERIKVDSILSQSENNLIRERKEVKSRDLLLATVSHDLRNPLHCITIAADMIKINGDVQQCSDLITQAVRVMQGIIEQLLLAERFRPGKLQVNLLSQNIIEVIREVMLIHAPIAEEKGISLSFPLVDEEPLYIPCERYLIARTLMNLLSNAIRFTPASGKVRVSLADQQDRVVISISDEGPGIPADMTREIFERSCRIDSSEGGLGLGLYIAVRVIKAHGGSIWVESSTREGSIFSFSLLK
jgi:signal transduction histidine kinase